MIGHNRIGAAAYLSNPPAIIQQAKDWRYYESAILKLEESKGQLLHDYKESGAWKEHYKSWEAACVPFDISKRHADRLIAEIKSGTPRPASPATDKEETLNKLSVRPDPPKEEEPEPPRVKSADEKPREEPKRHEPKNNGKPIFQHSIWRELEELLGKALNRVDEANRVSPNPAKHALLIAAIKGALAMVRAWQNKP